MPQRRQYHQACGLAVGLEVIGERWTLLIVRELLIRPSRFNDLLSSLEGASPNMLSRRLHQLEQRGLITDREVPGDRRGREYLLTPLGHALRPAVLELARWGLAVATEEDTEATTRPGWIALALEAMSLRGRLDADISESYEFAVSGTSFYLVVRRGEPSLTDVRPDPEPVVTIEADAKTFLQIGSGLLSPVAALESGAVTAAGDLSAVTRCASMLGLVQSRPAVRQWTREGSAGN